MNYKINEICRLCLANSNLMIAIFSENSTYVNNMALKIMSIASVEIKQGDGLPNQICPKCLNLVQCLYDFKNLCEKSDSQLRHYIKQTQKTKELTNSIQKRPQQIVSIRTVEKTEKRILPLDRIDRIPISNPMEEEDEDDEESEESIDAYSDEDDFDETNESDNILGLSICDPLELVQPTLEEDEEHLMIKEEKHSSGEGDQDMNEPVFSESPQESGINDSNNYDLKNHKIYKGYHRSFKCNICSKAFHNSSGLKNHQRIHSGEKPYKCEICQKLFTQKSNLVTHLKIHSGIKPFSCEFCHRAFRQKVELKNHMRLHSGEKPYDCEICTKNFTTVGNYLTHVRSHFGFKKYKCNSCPKSYARKANLNAHVKSHSSSVVNSTHHGLELLAKLPEVSIK